AGTPPSRRSERIHDARFTRASLGRAERSSRARVRLRDRHPRETRITQRSSHALDDVEAERARARVVLRHADLSDLKGEADVAEGGNHLVARELDGRAGGLDAAVGE